MRLVVADLLARKASDQELMGHSDASTAMTYAYVLDRGGRGIGCPLARN